MHPPLKLLLVCSFLLPSCLAALIEDCGSKIGKFSQVTLSDCADTDDVCVLVHDHEYDISVDFTIADYVETVRATYHLIYQGEETYLTGPQDNACLNSGLECPLQPSQIKVYTFRAIGLRIPSELPIGEMELKVKLKNEADDEIVCVLIPVLVQYNL